MTDSSQTSETPTPAPDRPRRRFLRRAVIGAALASVAAGVGIVALAEGGPRGWHRAHFMHGPLDPARLDEHLDRMLKHLYVELDATEAQQQRLAPIAKAAVRDLLPLRTKMTETRRQALDLLARETVDRAALESLRAEKLALAEQGSRRLAQALADAADVLTPAQRRALAERLERRHRSWHRG
jgi:protein CpxP